MDKQVIFKSAAFGGFDKKSVTDYIFKLNQSAEEAQIEAEERVRNLNMEKNALEDELSETLAKLAQQQNELSATIEELRAARQKNNEMTNLAQSLKNEIAEKEIILSERDAVILEKNSIIEEKEALILELSEKLQSPPQIEYKKEDNLYEYPSEESEDTEEAEIVYEYTGDEYDEEEASSALGRLFIEAHNEADRIVSASKEEADEILAAARADADILLIKAKGQAERIIEEAGDAVEESYSAFEEFKSDLVYMQKSVLSSLESMRERTSNLTVPLETLSGKIEVRKKGQQSININSIKMPKKMPATVATAATPAPIKSVPPRSGPGYRNKLSSDTGFFR